MLPREIVLKDVWFIHITFVGTRKRKRKPDFQYALGSVMEEPGDPIMKAYLEWWREYDDKA